MSQIAIAHPLSALKEISNQGCSPNFVTSPAMKDAFNPPPVTVKGNLHYERPLGDSELTYYLQSRANGVNDM